MKRPPSVTEHGWNQYAHIIWIDEPFPDDINELSLNDESGSDEGYGSDNDSDDSENNY